MPSQENKKSYEKSAPKVFIRTFGCQMNSSDSEFIAGLFSEKGYGFVDSPDKADVVLFNTCSVREHAEERAISSMGQLMHKHKNRIYGVVGCAAQALGDRLFKRLPGLNIVCGTGEIAGLPELVEKARAKTILALDNKDALLPEVASTYRENSKHAYVSIMRGCNNFCSYCIVPYVRGTERSRRVKDIVEEVKGLVKRGIRDITLLGQNVNSYKDKACGFVQLLKFVNDIEGIEKINFMTSHPKDATLKLFETMRDCGKVVKHLHLPLQSGSDRILGLMERRYTGKQYLSLAAKAREVIPGLRFTTDIIVGFPGETEQDFKDTLGLMKEVRFDSAYIFKYSPRPGTRAGEMPDDVPRETKKIRHKILLDLQKGISRKKTHEKTHCLCNN